jgi:hypothetical protein
MNSLPMMNAWASPSGLGYNACDMFNPMWEPSLKRASNLERSSGVEIIKISRIPAVIFYRLIAISYELSTLNYEPARQRLTLSPFSFVLSPLKL